MHVAAIVRFIAFAAAWAAGLAAAPAYAADGCAGVAHCRDLGAFTATVTQVKVTRKDAPTGYQTVRTTLRLTNTGDRPLALGWRSGASLVSDDQGLAYTWSNKAHGIGVVDRHGADAQFQLAPGESRVASFDGVVQYDMRRQVAGTVFAHDITLVELAPLGARQLRTVRDHLVALSGLTASAGYGATPQAAAAVNTPPPDVPAGADGCSAATACQVAGPLRAQVVRVQATNAGRATAYHTVRSTVRFTNLGAEPLILGYVKGSSAVSDENGQAYTWDSKAHGIGVVERSVADPQFRLAPGQSREASIESTLQYDDRHGRPGRVYAHDFTIAQLDVVGPTQVRTLHEYAFGFAGLRAGGAVGTGAAEPPAGDAAEAVQAVGKLVELFKGLKR